MHKLMTLKDDDSIKFPKDSVVLEPPPLKIHKAESNKSQESNFIDSKNDKVTRFSENTNIKKGE